jgi:GNAT superfamily N-acetyltransferase
MEDFLKNKLKMNEPITYKKDWGEFTVRLVPKTHPELYGIRAKNPLYVERFYINDCERNKGYGTELLNKIEQIAIDNDCDIVFGYVATKAEFTKNQDKYKFFPNSECIKYWLHDRGYAINADNNDFHKVLKGKEISKSTEIED